MAEVVAVLGLIASILGILDGIDKSTAIIKKYVHKSSSLRADLVPVLGKLAAFAGILRGLQLECELYESDNGRLQTFVHIREPLQVSEKATRTIMTRLDQVISIGGISISFGKVLNQETSTALHILDQTKSVLELALTADQRLVLFLFCQRCERPNFISLFTISLSNLELIRLERYSSRSRSMFEMWQKTCVIFTRRAKFIIST